MKKGKLLNSEISYVLSKMGHTDTIAIADCGLPIPNAVQRIDLAVKKGLPEFIPVLAVVLEELFIEKIILAEEILIINPQLNDEIIKLIKSVELQQKNNVEIEYIPHEKFKSQTEQSKAIIRTGEYKSYANIILISGVTF